MSGRQFAWRSTAWLAVPLGVLMLPMLAHADDLYSPSTYDALAADQRAHRVGDNLTIVVTEMTSASSDARTRIDKAANLNVTVSSVTHQRQGTLGLTNSFDGGGETERTDRLLGRITASVWRVESDGTLRVRGQQDIAVNNEKQKLTVEGRVRPQDIGPDNTILSSRLSDAKIAYTGRGVLTEGQRPGLLTRLLSWLRIL